MKNLLIAILLAILITYSLGHLADNWLDLSIRMDDELLSPLEAITGITIVGVVLAIVGFVVAVSVLGAVFFAFFAVFVGLLVVGVSVFWPMILVCLIVVWLVKDKQPSY